MAHSPQRESEKLTKYTSASCYTLPTPKPPLPGKSRLTVYDFEIVVARLRQRKVNSFHVPTNTDDPLDDALVLCRNSSICGLAQYVMQTLAEYELSLKYMNKAPSQDEVERTMAEEKEIKIPTLKKSYICRSRNVVESILRFFSLFSPLPSFAEPKDRPNSTPWGIIIILIVFLTRGKTPGDSPGLPDLVKDPNDPSWKEHRSRDVIRVLTTVFGATLYDTQLSHLARPRFRRPTIYPDKSTPSGCYELLLKGLEGS